MNLLVLIRKPNDFLSFFLQIFNGFKMSYKKIRRQLDELGYYQPLVPESLGLVEALLHDLLATTHNLKVCQDQKKVIKDKPQVQNRSEERPKITDPCDNVQVIELQKKVSDFQLLYKESLEVIKNLQIEIEERNKKILKLELTQKAQILTQSDKKLKPKMEMTCLVSSSSSSSGPTYDNVPSQDQLNVIDMYAQKNKNLELQVGKLQQDLKKAKEMLANVEKYWSQQALNNETNDNIKDEKQSSYALKLMKENQSLKEKLSQLEANSTICFHGKHLPPAAASGHAVPTCNDSVRASIEQSHANFLHHQHTNNLHKSVLTSQRIKKHPGTTVHGPSYCDKVSQKNHHHIDQQHCVSLFDCLV